MESPAAEGGIKKKKNPSGWPETLQTERRPKILPVIKLPRSAESSAAQSEGCAENLPKNKKDEEGENTEGKQPPLRL